MATILLFDIAETTMKWAFVRDGVLHEGEKVFFPEEKRQDKLAKIFAVLDPLYGVKDWNEILVSSYPHRYKEIEGLFHKLGHEIILFDRFQPMIESCERKSHVQVLSFEMEQVYWAYPNADGQTEWKEYSGHGLTHIADCFSLEEEFETSVHRFYVPLISSEYYKMLTENRKFCLYDIPGIASQVELRVDYQKIERVFADKSWLRIWKNAMDLINGNQGELIITGLLNHDLVMKVISDILKERYQYERVQYIHQVEEHVLVQLGELAKSESLLTKPTIAIEAGIKTAVAAEPIVNQLENPLNEQSSVLMHEQEQTGFAAKKVVGIHEGPHNHNSNLIGLSEVMARVTGTPSPIVSLVTPSETSPSNDSTINSIETVETEEIAEAVELAEAVEGAESIQAVEDIELVQAVEDVELVEAVEDVETVLEEEAELAVEKIAKEVAKAAANEEIEEELTEIESETAIASEMEIVEPIPSLPSVPALVELEAHVFDRSNEYIENPHFADGLEGWEVSGAAHWKPVFNLLTGKPTLGVILLPPPSPAMSLVQQSVNVPFLYPLVTLKVQVMAQFSEGVERASLPFTMKLQSREGGTQDQTLEANRYWETFEFDATAYAGQRIELSFFHVDQEATLIIDKVSLVGYSSSQKANNQVGPKNRIGMIEVQVERRGVIADYHPDLALVESRFAGDVMYSDDWSNKATGLWHIVVDEMKQELDEELAQVKGEVAFGYTLMEDSPLRLVNIRHVLQQTLKYADETGKRILVLSAWQASTEYDHRILIENILSEIQQFVEDRKFTSIEKIIFFTPHLQEKRHMAYENQVKNLQSKLGHPFEKIHEGDLQKLYWFARKIAKSAKPSDAINEIRVLWKAYRSGLPELEAECRQMMAEHGISISYLMKGLIECKEDLGASEDLIDIYEQWVQEEPGNENVVRQLAALYWHKLYFTGPLCRQVFKTYQGLDPGHAMNNAFVQLAEMTEIGSKELGTMIQLMRELKKNGG